MYWSVLSLLFTAINTALGTAGISNDTVSKWVDFAASLFSRGDPTQEALQALVDHINQMVAENRNPTTDEWNALKARSDAAHARIQGT